MSLAQVGPNHHFNYPFGSPIWVAACLDGLENGSHVSVTETERARLAIERVANIEQWRGDARLASRFGDQAIVLEDVRDRCLDVSVRRRAS